MKRLALILVVVALLMPAVSFGQIPKVQFLNVSVDPVPGTPMIPGETITVTFSYTFNTDSVGPQSLWEVRFDGTWGNRNEPAAVFKSGTPNVSSRNDIVNDIAYVMIPENTEFGLHTIDLYAAPQSWQPITGVWFTIEGKNEGIPITVGQQDTTPPVIFCPEDITVNVGFGETGAVVNYVVNATDDESGVDTLVCDPASGSIFPLGETTVTCTATDNAGNQATETFKVTVLGPTESLVDLAVCVYDLNLQNGIENSLDAKLDAALNALNDVNENNDVAAVNSLEAFISAVQAQSGNKIPVADADDLIAYALLIIGLLSAG